MLRPLTLAILGLLVGAYLLALAPGLIWPDRDAAAGWLIMAPLLTVYMLHALGVPGLLEHNGLCGWGMCAPTPLGWCAMVLTWIGAAWLVAWGLSAIGRRARAASRSRPGTPQPRLRGFRNAQDARAETRRGGGLVE